MGMLIALRHVDQLIYGTYILACQQLEERSVRPAVSTEWHLSKYAVVIYSSADCAALALL